MVRCIKRRDECGHIPMLSAE